MTEPKAIVRLERKGNMVDFLPADGYKNNDILEFSDKWGEIVDEVHDQTHFPHEFEEGETIGHVSFYEDGEYNHTI